MHLMYVNLRYINIKYHYYHWEVFVRAGNNCFFYRGVFIVLWCSFMRSWMKRVAPSMYCWLQLLHVTWYTALLRKHSLVSKRMPLSLVHGRSLVLWDRVVWGCRICGQCVLGCSLISKNVSDLVISHRH